MLTSPCAEPDQKNILPLHLYYNNCFYPRGRKGRPREPVLSYYDYEMQDPRVFTHLWALRIQEYSICPPLPGGAASHPAIRLHLLQVSSSGQVIFLVFNKELSISKNKNK